KDWQRWFLGCISQEYRNDRTIPLNKFPQESIQLLLLPRTNAILPHKNSGSFNVPNLLLEQTLPGQSWAQLPLIQPGQNPPYFQLLPNLFDNGFVYPLVAEEDIEVVSGDFALDGGLGNFAIALRVSCLIDLFGVR